MDAERVRFARGLLLEHARRTGLIGNAIAPSRYLWTDAFSVCTWLEIHRLTGSAEALGIASRLVEQVHEVLGKHRAGDARRGWISGLSEAEGREHPTRGGLRIGKPLPERGPTEAFDERLEWDRDGQYYHYLTKWMHALAIIANVRLSGADLRHAVELALAAHAAFVVDDLRGGKRMVWKCSVDLTRAQVPSMGQHDPLDGLLTLRSLRLQARSSGMHAEADALGGPIDTLRVICDGVDWRTADPLGIGGLLTDALRLARLFGFESDDADLLPVLLDAAVIGLDAFVRSDALRRPATDRLAFRELGLAIGLNAPPRIASLLRERGSVGPQTGPLLQRLERFDPVLPLADVIEREWSNPASRATANWKGHADINDVMLAAMLLPDGVLGH